MQRVREQNHEVSQFVNNPDLMCQTMEMIRIPTTIQEITRNHDRALINLERLPSGYKVRQRIYRDFQEPMLNVAHEQFGDNPLNTYSSSSGTANTSQVGTENTNLLPNPSPAFTPHFTALFKSAVLVVLQAENAAFHFRFLVVRKNAFSFPFTHYANNFSFFEVAFALYNYCSTERNYRSIAHARIAIFR
ncbi:hypothetical protein GJ496_000541 [Pomphorhynchus laevis]|nr:hypothetical protein GJ496_000541 [Pomphorhynchus laevis]